MADNKLTIAIIEDDLAISQMYRLKFESEGYRVETADNGEDGLAMLENVQPDVVLLDMMMPTMNGDEVLARTRATEWGKDLKVFILTNMGKEEAPARLQDLNVEAYIVKAEMTPKQVAQRVSKALE